MERYEFEDQISDYIENNLSLNKRKIFVEYLKNNQDAQELVDDLMEQCKPFSPIFHLSQQAIELKNDENNKYFDEKLPN